MDYASYKRLLNHKRIVTGGGTATARDGARRKGDTADPLLHVVLYNGDRRWDAPLKPAWRPQEQPAPLAVRYEVVDLLGARLDAVPRAKLLRRVAEVEQSIQAGTLPERMR